MAVRYSEAVHQFIRENVGSYTQREMAEKVNALFGTTFTDGSMKSYYANHKLKAGKRERKYSALWPKEVVEILMEVYKGRSYRDVREILEEKTGRTYSLAQIKTYYAAHKLDSGRTGHFPKGHVPFTKGKRWDDYMTPEAQEKSREKCYVRGHIPENRVPVGTIVVTVEGYKLIKRQDHGEQWERWQGLQRYVWEQHNGPIPEGNVIIFKDSDPLNCDIDNLLMISNGENGALNARGLRFEDPALTAAAVTMVRLENAIKEKRKH